MKEKNKEINPVYKAVRSSLFFPIGFYRYYKSQKISSIQKKFAESLSFFKAAAIGKALDGVLLVQMVKDYEYTIKLAAASKAIAKKNNLEVNFYDVDWMSRIGWNSKYKKKYDPYFKSGLERIYLHFGKKIIFNCEDRYHDQSFIKQKLEQFKKELKTPEDVLAIKFENVWVGDLLYDTYLRYFHQPTIEDINKEVLLVIEIGLNVFYNFSHFLKQNKVKALLNTYSSYIEHGIPARVCLDKDIVVYTTGSSSYIIQKLSKDFPYHQINHTLFSPDKKLTEDQLELARRKFTPRFEGKIDAATSYMRVSAFSDKPVDERFKKLFSEKKRNIIIYVHDFYDSPHVNRKLQFPDLYQFLKQTLAALTDLANTTVFIKTHPNGMPGCKEKTIELVKGFNKNHFHVINEEVSNINIISLKPDLIATARGTVCLEMAYVEIPTVALFDNLYANFKFTHTCPDKESYFSILRGENKPQNNFNKEKVLSFYFQAFLEKTMQAENNIFDLLASFKGDNYNDRYLEAMLSGGYLKDQKTLVDHYSAALAD